jgi:6-phosphogluconolactonase
MNGAGLERFPDLEAASRHAAGLTARVARSAAAERGRFSLALSGGSTPARFFELLAGEDLPWDLVHVFWADERLVAQDSPDSNFRLAREHLLSGAPIPTGNVHPMAIAPPGPTTPEQQARAYEGILRSFFGGEGFPAFDVIHLGLGGDGHTASLFPGQPALSERGRLVVPVEYAKASPPVPRLTLTLPVINAARQVFFLISGSDKLRLAEDILAGRGGAYPADSVRPAGRLLWLAG